MAGGSQETRLTAGKPDVRAQLREELAARFLAWEEKPYRVDQLLRWLYQRRVVHWSAMVNLPQGLRERLAEVYSLHPLQLLRRQGAADSTQKFLWQLADHALVESVLIPANLALYGEASDRRTLCISTQVGCAYGCKFCASGLNGWKRNLTADEIVQQVLAVERQGEVFDPEKSSRASLPPTAKNTEAMPPGRVVDNLVVMGMGEPLANYENLIRGLTILNAPWGHGLGARKITVSTSGLVPEIRRLAEEPFQFRLAISLHGATNEVRNRLMPVNRKYPLEALVGACAHYERRKGRMLTFEYILIADVNDALDQVRPLADLANRFQAKVNLIPYNTVAGLPWRRPDDARLAAFQAALEHRGVKATLRREKGCDIDAACGQLRLKTERALRGEVDLSRATP